MKRLLMSLAVTALLVAAAATPASADFGFKDADVTFTNTDGSAAIQAGAHPFAMTTTLDFNTVGNSVLNQPVPAEDLRDLVIAQIPGLVAAPEAPPRCPNAVFLAPIPVECPVNTVIGTTDVEVNKPGEIKHARVYNLTPPPGVLLKIGFEILQVPLTIEVGLNQSPPYNGVVTLTNAPQVLLVYGSKVTIWGNPADPAHDAQRGGGGGSDLPFLTVPRACDGPLPTLFKADSWQTPGPPFAEASPLTHDDALPPNPLGFVGCDKLAFNPSISAQPTTKAAESPTGMDFGIDVADEGLTNSTGLANADIREAIVTFPEGMTANPSLAESLEACSEAQLARETLRSAPGEGCPEASKIGTVEVQSPLIEESVTGALFLAIPHENPAGSLIAAYLVIRNPTLGIIVKQTLEVQPNPVTGQLQAIAKDIPQLPFSHLKVHLREGARSPLISPPRCGPHEVQAELVPSSGGQPILATSTFETITGPGGGNCPVGALPFNPGLQAGSLNNDAGRFSPFYLRLTRRDGDRDLTKFTAKLPPGLVGKLAGTTQCSDAAIALAKSKTGLEEQAAPSCPSSSQIGHVLGGAGVGSQLIYVPGSLYMAGPFHGAPLSVVGIVPAVAGPFDVGTVVVRQALFIDPRTAQVRVDGEASDPIPHILAGIPLRVRDIRVYVDRPNFTLNPTSCAPSQVAAQLWGEAQPASIAARFQATNCAALSFKPNLALSLKGGTKRGGHPALTSTYTPRAGDANLSQLVVRLPRSAFLDQAHIRTICTRVQFAADACPAAAIYGHATATTPLLDQPLEGPVYLRSSDHNLPDFVADLHGLVDFEAVARIDSIKGGIRATFEGLPDAPITKVVVQMQGAKKGLIVNSRDLCVHKSHANIQMSGHNGRHHTSKPLMRASCGKARAAHRRPAKRR
jgi:hypothetical protein